MQQSLDDCQPSYMLVGNRCGHDPESPRFFIPNSKHKLRPDVIQFAINNLEKFYQTPAKWLLSLRASRLSSRQERSEGRERDADVIGVILHYVELASMQVGVPNSIDGFVNLSLDFMARQIGWRTDKDDKEDKQRKSQGLQPRYRGIKRIWRSIRVLKQAGYIEIYTRAKKSIENPFKYIGLPAIKKIHPKLFLELGISALRLSIRRDQAAKRVQNKQKNAQEIDNSKSQKIATMINQAVLRPQRTKIFSQSIENLDYQTAHEKQRIARCFELKQLPENQALLMETFYTKYPELQREEWHKHK